MIISGCEGDGVEDFPKWEENLTFALHLQNTVEEKYDGLMRPVFFCNRKYNMNVTPCSLLLEFGTDANTLEEAVYSASLIGKSISEMLDKELKK
jgi:stage II sporulation protein P